MVSKVEAKRASEERKRLERLQFALWELDALGREGTASGLLVRGLSARAPTSPEGDWLVTLRAIDGEGKRWVAFESANEIQTAITRIVEKLESDELNWRADNG